MSFSTEPIKKEKSENINPGDSLYMQPDVALFDDRQWQYVKKRYHISARELEVAKLVCQGFVNGEVAQRLDVKPGTIKTHLRSIFAKTHAKNRITMLLRFMDDVNKFFNESPGTLPIHTIDREKSIQKKMPSVRN